MKTIIRIGILTLIIVSVYVGFQFFKKKSPVEQNVMISEEENVFSISEEIQKKYSFQTTQLSEAPDFERIYVPGVVSYDLENTARIGSRVQGRIIKIFVNEGDYIKKNQNVFSIASTELGEMESRYKKAVSRKESLRIQLDRAKELYEKKITSAKEYESTLMEYNTSKTEAENSYNALLSYGLSSSEIQNILNGKTYSLSLNIKSPLSGTITERNAIIGQSVSVEDNLFTVSNLSKVWVILELYEKDLNMVSVGQFAEIIPVGNETGSVKARITHVGEIIDPVTRTSEIRFELDNKNRRFRPGQSVSSLLKGSSQDYDEDKKTFTLPIVAIHKIEGEDFVFLKLEDGNFQAKPVEVGKTIDDQVEIISGLEIEDKVVTEGSFILKSEYLKI